jgi:hypothetical protein
MFLYKYYCVESEKMRNIYVLSARCTDKEYESNFEFNDK